MKISKKEKNNFAFLVAANAALMEVPWAKARCFLARLLPDEKVHAFLTFYFEHTRGEQSRRRKKRKAYKRRRWERRRRAKGTAEMPFLKEIKKAYRSVVETKLNNLEQRPGEFIALRENRSVSQARKKFLHRNDVAELLRGLQNILPAEGMEFGNCFNASPEDFFVLLARAGSKERLVCTEVVQKLRKCFLAEIAKGGSRKIGAGMRRQRSSIGDFLAYKTLEQCIFSFFLEFDIRWAACSVGGAESETKKEAA